MIEFNNHSGYRITSLIRSAARWDSWHLRASIVPMEDVIKSYCDQQVLKPERHLDCYK
jgi:hypothetical protein